MTLLDVNPSEYNVAITGRKMVINGNMKILFKKENTAFHWSHKSPEKLNRNLRVSWTFLQTNNYSSCWKKVKWRGHPAAWGAKKGTAQDCNGWSAKEREYHVRGIHGYIAKACFVLQFPVSTVRVPDWPKYRTHWIYRVCTEEEYRRKDPYGLTLILNTQYTLCNLQS